ncbi:hypothetical protein N431DRAFT_456052 [Stipitochalara longipes BDJ]|nr:hypothetical protein N431DRAFT_456052 [Stipitochalara longipes BDJ]
MPSWENSLGHWPLPPLRAITEPPIKIAFRKFPPEIRKSIYKYELHNRTSHPEAFTGHIVQIIRGRLRIITLNGFPLLYADKAIMTELLPWLLCQCRLEIDLFLYHDFSYINTRMASKTLLANITGTDMQYLLQNCIKSVKIRLFHVETGFIVPSKTKKTFRKSLRKMRKELLRYRALRELEIRGTSALPIAFLSHNFGFEKIEKKGGILIRGPVILGPEPTVDGLLWEFHNDEEITKDYYPELKSKR